MRVEELVTEQPASRCLQAKVKGNFCAATIVQPMRVDLPQHHITMSAMCNMTATMP
jgi:hypothetical protein